jgi:hypothetical protein
MAKKNQIQTFTSKGNTVPGEKRGGVKASPVGHFDPTTGKVYQHPRVTADPLKGSSVKVTNPRVAGPAAAQRTQSLGMGAVGQGMRNQ